MCACVEVSIAYNNGDNNNIRQTNKTIVYDICEYGKRTPFFVVRCENEKRIELKKQPVARENALICHVNQTLYSITPK